MVTSGRLALQSRHYVVRCGLGRDKKIYLKDLRAFELGGEVTEGVLTLTCTGWSFVELGSCFPAVEIFQKNKTKNKKTLTQIYIKRRKQGLG